jgi:hypothetical protein
VDRIECVWQNNFTTGDIDEMAIWNQELQASDIRQLNNMSGAGPY